MNKEVCWKCKGKKQIRVRRMTCNSGPNADRFVSIPCPACKGKGYIGDEEC
jgi:DnaJ-class molecular chaperone